jgi:hypothetical protein
VLRAGSLTPQEALIATLAREIGAGTPTESDG